MPRNFNPKHASRKQQELLVASVFFSVLIQAKVAHELNAVIGGGGCCDFALDPEKQNDTPLVIKI